jgi:beta-glucosidase
MNERIQRLLREMTLEEKASLCSGQDLWHLKGIGRLGIPPIMVTDGPHGLRKQSTSAGQVDLSKTVPATCFPTAAATGSSWDRHLLYEIGCALGEECQQEDVAVILGPGANIKRSPLCGRNFEFFSEDPYLTGQMAASLIRGVQAQGVGTSLKHYAVNNQETRRMTVDAVVDERALREIYLAGFEAAVKDGHPWTVMNAYNKVNGTYCSEHESLLTSILRDEWGHVGIVVTDWGACNDRVAGLKAGQDLEMPSSGGLNDARIARAVKEGALDEAVLDRTVARLLELIFRASESHKEGYRYDVDAHHALARRAAAASAVLLKNDGGRLPLPVDAKIALIGAFAKSPRYQGAGSSLMAPSRLDNTFDEMARRGLPFAYAAGYTISSDAPDEALIQEACALARDAAVAVVMAGLPPIYETEGVDRDHMRLPESHNQLILRVAEANPNLVVLLSNGAPVEMPWLDKATAVLDLYLGGQAGGSAAIDLLYGDVNPSGKLAETFPVRLEDNPSHCYFPAGPKTVEYRESLYVGYRYYEAAKKRVLFPFGHGLSYTSFEYSDFALSKERISDGEDLAVSVTVKNTGAVAGAEIVQLYVRDVESTAFRPGKELKGFDKVELKPGETRRVDFCLDRRAFAYYNVSLADWHVEGGAFEILVGASSADIRAWATVWVDASRPDVPVPDLRRAAPEYYHLPAETLEISDAAFQAVYGRPPPPGRPVSGEPFTILSTLGDIKHNFIGGFLYRQIRVGFDKALATTADEPTKLMMAHTLDELPLRSLVMMSGGQLRPEIVNGLLLLMNGKVAQGVVALVKASGAGGRPQSRTQ